MIRLRVFKTLDSVPYKPIIFKITIFLTTSDAAKKKRIKDVTTHQELLYSYFLFSKFCFLLKKKKRTENNKKIH